VRAPCYNSFSKVKKDGVGLASIVMMLIQNCVKMSQLAHEFKRWIHADKVIIHKPKWFLSLFKECAKIGKI
jgi:hypothetical protein